MTNFLLYLIFATLAKGFFGDAGTGVAVFLGVILFIVALVSHWRGDSQGEEK